MLQIVGKGFGLFLWKKNNMHQEILQMEDGIHAKTGMDFAAVSVTACGYCR